jgi:hypothetical protein
MVALIVKIHEDPNWATILVALATLATAAIALVTARLALRSLRQNRENAAEAEAQNERHALQTRAHQYLERYNSQHHLEARARLIEFFTIKPEEERSRIARWEDMSYGEKLDTVRGLNFWEELAGMYNRKLVDREIIADYFGSEAVSIWNRVTWFVEYQRRTVNWGAMQQLRNMCKAIQASSVRTSSPRPAPVPRRQ